LDESRSFLPDASRDDTSELSFYRRLVEDHVAVTTRSCEISRRGTSSNVVSSDAKCERSVSDSKLKKPKYRPYTIEEYRSLSVPRLDRSLGPDKDEVQAKVRLSHNRSIAKIYRCKSKAKIKKCISIKSNVNQNFDTSNNHTR